MGRGGAATRGLGIPTGVAFRVQRATTKRSYAEFSAIDIKVFYCYLVLGKMTTVAPFFINSGKFFKIPIDKLYFIKYN